MSGVCLCAYSYYSPEKEQATRRPYTRLDLLHLGPLFPYRTKDAKGEERRGWWGETPSSAGQIATWAPHLPPPPMRSSACSSSPVPQATAN